MTVGAVLLVYALALGIGGGALCRRSGGLERAPRLGAALLLSVAWSVPVALFLAGLTIAVPHTALSSGVSELLGACIIRIRSAYSTPGGTVVAVAGLCLSAVIVVRVCWVAGQVVQIRRTERRKQQALIATAGRRVPEWPAVIVDESRPVAYSLADRAGTIVLTSGLLGVLTPDQVAAVIAHEQAHLRGRHHSLLASAAVVAGTLPALPLLRELSAVVRRLIEMQADDVAARAHAPETIAAALFTVATGQPAGSLPITPASALAAGDSDAVARVRRLLLPPAMLTRRGRGVVRAGIAAAVLVPVLTAFAPAAVAANRPPVAAVRATVPVHRPAEPQSQPTLRKKRYIVTQTRAITSRMA
ncbi:M56 family metallopeptidase [Kribbella sp. GL6]|uniref:M56 family metallopeptidase n=1 Tax=Kribbella sp. GL6 TaxID=3419765 RepID=UPI003D08A7D5